MLLKVSCRCLMLCAVSGLVFSAGACGGNGLPSEVTIELPDGTEVSTTLGSGVISLADTTWDFYRVANTGQGIAFVRVQFGSQGELAMFENNTIASSIFGDTIIFDGQRHNTSQVGLQYAAATFGAETADATGFTFEARLTGFAAGLEAATATATAVAEFDPDDPDTVMGTFTFTSRVTLLDIPEGNIDDEFSFVGQRVVD